MNRIGVRELRQMVRDRPRSSIRLDEPDYEDAPDGQEVLKFSASYVGEGAGGGRECLVCLGVFDTPWSRQRFCSTKCRVAWHRKNGGAK